MKIDIRCKSNALVQYQ